jgi:hypothetical protein
LKALIEKFYGVVKPVATKPLKRQRPEKMLMNSRPVARDAEINGQRTIPSCHKLLILVVRRLAIDFLAGYPQSLGFQRTAPRHGA